MNAKLNAALLFLIAFFIFLSEKGLAESIGTGFFYNQNGDILTNKHVVDGCSDIKIRLPNKMLVNGQLIAKSSVFDIAAIRSNVSTNRFAALPVENRYPLIPTGKEDVFTYGYSYNKAGLNGWAIAGLIVEEPRIEQKYFLKLRIDVTPGASGSPVLGRHNLLVGIITGGKETGKIPMAGWDRYLGTTEVYALNGNAITHFINESRIYASTWEPDRAFAPMTIINHAMEITSLIICK